ncbi:MAG TPA: serine/threonine-protein kinase, partial [Kofleriaceae bacterium]|nr:serine/threonine-protein kinase [Kofleriaceae bacterium]
MTDSEIRYGTKIGGFVVTGELGAGGMGVVYAAHDPELDRRVALKVLRAAAATEEERLRMLREGQAMARVTHPNVITVYEVGVEGSLVFLAQELLDAGTLGEWLEKRPRSQAEILDKFLAAGRGLAAAHKAGLVHRDFKPDNVLLGKDGRVRVSDFGLARALGPGEDDLPAATRANMARAQLELSRSPMSPLTRTGAVLGTPMFMAPEQHNGERADERSDQFAFSVALYRALYGEWPFAGKTAVALADAVIAGRLEKPPRGAKVPAWLRKIVVRGLATDPATRYPSMDAMLAELAKPPSNKLRKIVVAVVAVGLVGGAVVGGYALRTHDDELQQTRLPLPNLDPKLLTIDHNVGWFSTAVERDQLAEAAEKYDMAGALARDNAQPAAASIAWSSGALVLALQGDLDQARAHLKDADASKGSDPNAIAYSDLANAAILRMAGDFESAIARATECEQGFATTPELAALCAQLHGEAVAERGDRVLARQALAHGLALALAAHSEVRALAIKLDLLVLELDEGGKLDDIVTRATALQADADRLGGTTPAIRAAIVLARAHVAQAETQQAIADLDRVKPEAIQDFDAKTHANIALFEAQALLGDDD